MVPCSGAILIISDCHVTFCRRYCALKTLNKKEAHHCQYKELHLVHWLKLSSVLCVEEFLCNFNSHGGNCDWSFFSMKPVTPQLNPRYWSHLMILAFRFSGDASWPRNHCFEAWTNRRSIEDLDIPCSMSWLLISGSSSSKTCFVALLATVSLTPFWARAWNCTMPAWFKVWEWLANEITL